MLVIHDANKKRMKTQRDIERRYLQIGFRLNVNNSVGKSVRAVFQTQDFELPKSQVSHLFTILLANEESLYLTMNEG